MMKRKVLSGLPGSIMGFKNQINTFLKISDSPFDKSYFFNLGLFINASNLDKYIFKHKTNQLEGLLRRRLHFGNQACRFSKS